MGWGEGSGQTVGIERTFLLVSAATRRSEASHTLSPPTKRRLGCGGAAGWGHRGMGQGHLGAEVSYSPRPEEPDASVYVFTPSRLSLRVLVSLLESLILGTCVFTGQILTAFGLPSKAPHPHLSSLPPPPPMPAFAFQKEGQWLDSQGFPKQSSRQPLRASSFSFSI